MIVTGQLFVPRLIAKHNPTAVLTVSALLVGLGFGLTSLADTGPMYAIIVAIWTIGEMLQVPIMSALVAGLSPSTARGRYQATFQVSFSAAAFLGPVFGGVAIGTLGQNALWTGCLALGVIVAGLNIALSSARHRRLAEAPTA